jgi:predicted DNA-binding transcriptional regulator YafY
MNRIDRLFAIILLFQRDKRLRAHDLAERFSISERTIYRDIQALTEMGIPISTLPGEGYELLSSFRLPPIILSSHEAEALFLAARMLIHNSEGNVTIHAETALAKLAAVLPTPVKEHVQQQAQIISFFPTNRLNVDEPNLLKVLSAIKSQQTIQITYKGYRSTDVTEREVDPYDLTIADGVWYISGYCHLRKDIRSFRLNRIIELTIQTEKFEQRLFVEARSSKIKVSIRFSADVLTHVRERQHYAFIEERDGVMLYEVNALSEIQNWVFGFGSAAQVLSPQELRSWMKEEAERLINYLT